MRSALDGDGCIRYVNRLDGNEKCIRYVNRLEGNDEVH